MAERPLSGSREPQLLRGGPGVRGPLPSPVTLKAVKADPQFADFALVRVPRLSVMPVTDAQWQALEAMARA
ncbi:MAG: EVE domain-containing protein [Vicinamibacterales bacterium]